MPTMSAHYKQLKNPLFSGTMVDRFRAPQNGRVRVNSDYHTVAVGPSLAGGWQIGILSRRATVTLVMGSTSGG